MTAPTLDGNHTPAPWTIYELDDESLMPLKAVVCVLGNYLIQCDAKHGTLKERADAHLIAAAPDLLKALKAILKGQSMHTRALARAAIAKAEVK